MHQPLIQICYFSVHHILYWILKIDFYYLFWMDINGIQWNIMDDTMNIINDTMNTMEISDEFVLLSEEYNGWYNGYYNESNGYFNGSNGIYNEYFNESMDILIDILMNMN